MTFVLIAHYRARESAIDTVTESLRNMVEPSRAEPGNIVYRVNGSAVDPAEFFIFEEYVDESAFEAHLASPHFERHLRGGVLPNLESRVRHDLVPLEPH
ncbi:putative quinol monooxygenase [Rhodococcus sp. NPDC056743]|uniref:putative quinol monooxygenase n=1 Tax=Rhodococcus sp. NPDC056743 TaxID=3345934 RepID=UPI00366C6F32